MAYLTLAALGAAHAVYGLLSHLVLGGGLPGLIGAWQGAAWDPILAAAALTLWITAEVAVRRNWLALIALPATFLAGVGCGLPLYLFLRTRPV